MADRSEIVVVGSMNIDMITYASRLPGPGETVIGDRFQTGFGGKGANQAVMASLLGSDVSMIGCLGDDPYGQTYREGLNRVGVNTQHIHTVKGSSGVAPIWVEPDGTNRIIVVAGANDALTAEQAARGVQAHPHAAVVIGQFEVPQSVTAAAFSAAKSQGAVTVLNPAPATPIGAALLAVTDWLVPNESEFALISGGKADRDGDLVSFARTSGTRLVVTMGSDGAALVATDGSVIRVEATPVVAIDTTGAGDAFVGSFAHGLAQRWDEITAIRLAIRCAADSVTRPGTQTSFPTPEQCVEFVEAVAGR